MPRSYRGSVSALTRFLYPLPARRSLGQIILWWEQRRLAYNLIVGATGIISLAVIALFSLLPPNPHLMGPPPLFILVYAVIANACYTLGWVLEGAAHTAWHDGVQPVGPVLFRQGLIFSVGLTLLPIVMAVVVWAVKLTRLFF